MLGYRSIHILRQDLKSAPHEDAYNAPAGDGESKIINSAKMHMDRNKQKIGRASCRERV